MATATWIDGTTEREVRVQGDLDHGGCEELVPALGEAVAGKVRTVVLRMEGVGSICSRGVTMLLKAYHRLRTEGRTLLVTGLRPQVRDVLERLGVLQVVAEWDPEAAARS
jgi:SulP family sulfate permease